MLSAQDTNRRVYMHPTTTTSIPLNSQHTPISRCNTISKMQYRRQRAVPEQAMRVQNQDLQHIWIVTGPAGCGKTTVAKNLSKKLQVEYIEGDDVSTTSPLPLPLKMPLLEITRDIEWNGSWKLTAKKKKSIIQKATNRRWEITPP